MSGFHNTQNLWAYINKEITKHVNVEEIYSENNFFEDLKRSNEELYINGTLIDPILCEAKNQIHVIRLSIQTILSVVKTLKEDPDKIKEAYQKIALIPEIESSQFETKLLDATKLLGSDPGPIGVVFRNFCSIRSLILFLKKMDPLKIEEHEEKFTQIKNKLLSMASMQKIEINQIEAKFLDKTANKIFNQLFENNEKTEIKSDFEKYRSKKKNDKEECLKKFLKLSLHQNFIFPNINILNQLAGEHYIFCNPEKRSIDLSYTDNGLFIQVSFFTQKVFEFNSSEVLKTTGDDFFVKGVAKYKINIHSYNKNGWIAKFYLIDSILECKEKFKAILDTRNVLEKIREFIATNLDKIIAFLNLDQPVSVNKTKFKPVFFVSDTGSSVSKIISDNTEFCGNILNLTINRIK